MCALEISVELRDKKLYPYMDVNNDGNIDAADAAEIIRIVMSQTLTGN